MKGVSAWRNGKLCFRHFLVKKDSDTMYSVYRCSPFSNSEYGEVITSAKTLKEAAKKAKLLDIGYRLAHEDMKW